MILKQTLSLKTDVSTTSSCHYHVQTWISLDREALYIPLRGLTDPSLYMLSKCQFLATVFVLRIFVSIWKMLCVTRTYYIFLYIKF